MKDEIKGNGFVMRPSPLPKKRTAIEYARAWLTGELEKNVLEYGLPALNDVMAVLHAEPQLLNSFVKHDVDVRLYHDFPILEQVKDGYDVSYTDRGRRMDTVHFSDVWPALVLYWQYRGLQ